MAPEGTGSEAHAVARMSRRGALAGGAAALGAGLWPLAGPPVALGQPGGDASILRSAVRLEQTKIATYDAIARSRVLDPRASALVRELREHELEHHAALGRPLKTMGGTLPDPLGLEDIEGLGRLEGGRHALRVALGLEERALAAYQDAVRRLRGGPLIQLAATILASEGQHVALLREALGREPLSASLEREDARV